MEEQVKELMHIYEHNKEQKRKIKQYFEELSPEKLGLVLKAIPVDQYDNFFLMIAKAYARKLATNVHEERLIIESVSYKREKHKIKMGTLKLKPTGKYPQKFNNNSRRGKARGRVKITKVI